MGAIACFGLVFPSFSVLLHLAWHDHVYFGAHGQHVHSHAAVTHAEHGHHGEHGHRHGTEASRPGESDPDHRSHPVADHLDPLAGPAVPTTLVHRTIGLAPQEAPILLLETPSGALALEAESDPRAPPPRVAAGPRAPPIVA